MDKRAPLAKLNDLQEGDLILLKNHYSGKMDLNATGPALFLEFTNKDKTSALVYNLYTKRVTKAKISHMAPVKVCWLKR